MKQPGGRAAGRAVALVLLAFVSFTADADEAWQRISAPELGVALLAPADWVAETDGATSGSVPTDGRTAALALRGQGEVRVEVVRWPRTAGEAPDIAARHHEYLLDRLGDYKRRFVEPCASGLGPGVVTVGTLRTGDGAEHGVVFATFGREQDNLTIGAFCRVDQVASVRAAWFNRLVSSLASLPEGPAPASPTTTPATPPAAETRELDPLAEVPSQNKPGELAVTYLDPSGLTFRHPMGWRARRHGSGGSLAPARGPAAGQGVLWWTAAAAGRSARQLATEALEAWATALPGLAASSLRSLGETCIVVAVRQTAEGQTRDGVVVCAAGRDRALALGGYCRPAQAASDAPILAAILASLEVDPRAEIGASWDRLGSPASDPHAFWALAAQALSGNRLTLEQETLLAEVRSWAVGATRSDDQTEHTSRERGGAIP